MKVTFLIGNGFDLACGLKTSYADVYEEYIKAPSATPIVEQFKADLIKEKTKENWGNWSDFEMGMAKFARNFSNEKDFIACVADFKKFLKQHLQKEQEKFEGILKLFAEVSSTELLKYIKECINDFYIGTTKKVEKEIKEKRKFFVENSFVNFNYTTTLDSILDVIYKGSPFIYHIHGTLADGDLTLGVDDVSQIRNSFTLTKQGRRMFVKPFFNDEEDPKKVEAVKQLIIESECICAFGLSFGDSDLTWKNTIVEWLKSHKDHHLFLYDYNCSKISIDDIAMRRNEEETQKAVILSKKGFCEESAQIFEQIHIPIGKTIFDIVAFIKDFIEKNKKTA